MQSQLFITDKAAKVICLMGQKEKCCKYLTYGAHGFFCAKLSPQLKEQIDKLKFVAEGDNCQGIPMLIGHLISRN